MVSHVPAVHALSNEVFATPAVVTNQTLAVGIGSNLLNPLSVSTNCLQTSPSDSGRY